MSSLDTHSQGMDVDASRDTEHPDRRLREQRLNRLRAEAARHAGAEASATDHLPGYYGLPALQPPVWTWEIPAYFFVGGLAGGAGILAMPAALFAQRSLALWTLWTAVIGAAVGAGLLISDLGRPQRFYNMLRVFKWRSPMSVGSWILTFFSAAVGATALLLQLSPWLGGLGLSAPALRIIVLIGCGFSALFGAALATYTGVLIGATAVPAWHTHHRLLPAHFGIAGLGSAAAVFEVAGFHLPALWALGLLAAAAETIVSAWVELRRHGARDLALHRGRAAWLLRGSGLFAGPLALVLRLTGFTTLAALAFLLGVLGTRYGWLSAGRASARDPEAALARG